MSWPPADGTLYRPSNGTEGCGFYEDWCTHCQHDKPMSEGKDFQICDAGDVCQIIADTLFYDVDDPKYPSEWTWQNGCPTCSKFLSVDDETPRITPEERAANLELPLEPRA